MRPNLLKLASLVQKNSTLSLPWCILPLVTVYVDLVVFTHIAGTS